MTRNQMAVLVEAIDALRLDKKWVGFKNLTEQQQDSLMLYLETWVESKVALAFRLAAGTADSEDKMWAGADGQYRTKEGLREQYDRLAQDYYARRR